MLGNTNSNKNGINIMCFGTVSRSCSTYFSHVSTNPVKEDIYAVRPKLSKVRCIYHFNCLTTQTKGISNNTLLIHFHFRKRKTHNMPFVIFHINYNTKTYKQNKTQNIMKKGKW